MDALAARVSCAASMGSLGVVRPAVMLPCCRNVLALNPSYWARIANTDEEATLNDVNKGCGVTA